MKSPQIVDCHIFDDGTKVRTIPNSICQDAPSNVLLQQCPTEGSRVTWWLSEFSDRISTILMCKT